MIHLLNFCITDADISNGATAEEGGILKIKQR